MIPLNKSYKNRKVSLTIHCKYKYLDSTVQRAEDRRQKFAVCRLPFAVNVKLNLSTRRTLARENFNSARRRRAISLSMLKFPCLSLVGRSSKFLLGQECLLGLCLL